MKYKSSTLSEALALLAIRAKQYEHVHTATFHVLQRDGFISASTFDATGKAISIDLSDAGERQLRHISPALRWIIGMQAHIL